MMGMACRMVRNDWQKRPWLRLIVCGGAGALAGAMLIVLAGGLLLSPGPADQGALALAMAAGLGLASAACWHGGTRAWADVGRAPIPAPIRQWVYLALAVPTAIALPGAALGAGYAQDWLGAALAGAGIYAWRRYGRHATPGAPIVPAPVDPPAPGHGPERLH